MLTLRSSVMESNSYGNELWSSKMKGGLDVLLHLTLMRYGEGGGIRDRGKDIKSIMKWYKKYIYTLLN